MDAGNLIPFAVLTVTVLGGFWKIYAMLDAKIERLREILLAALSTEMGTSRSDTRAIRDRLDRFIDGYVEREKRI